MHLTFLGNSGFQIKTNNKIIYIDPYSPHSKLEKADLILISHADYDHFNEQSIRKLENKNTKIFSTREVSSKILGCKTVKSGEKESFDAIHIEFVKALNPEHEEIIGFIICIEGKRIYFTSDTKYLLELENIHADIVLISIGGSTTMNCKTAAELVNKIQPMYSIPCHFGSIEGNLDDALRFKALVESSRKTKVFVMRENETMEF